MLQGKQLILATRPFAKEIKWKSWYYTISTLFLLIGANALTFMNVPIAIRLTGSILSGFLISRFFVIYHDYLHSAILMNSKVAEVIFTLFGLYVLAPSSIWKRSHDYHHVHNSKLFSASIGSYPILTKEKFLKCSRSEQIAYLATRNPITIAFGYLSMFVYGLCIQSFLSKPRNHWDSLIALVLHLAFIMLVCYFLGWLTMLLAIIIPFTIACGFGAYLFYAQHNFPGVSFKENKIEWSYEHAALESSSFMKMNPFLQWATANIGYHHIHHINARIPFYRLPEVMKKIPEMQRVKTTTLKPRDIYRCFKLKVWDTEKQQMVYIKAK